VVLVGAMLALWALLRPVRSRRPLLLWPLCILADLLCAAAQTPTAAAVCTGTIVLGFLFAGLTQPRGTSLLLIPPALVSFLVINAALPRDQLLMRMGIASFVWAASTEMPAWLTVRLRLARAELARLAATDPLTGLANRRHWEEHSPARSVPPTRTLPPERGVPRPSCWWISTTSSASTTSAATSPATRCWSRSRR
jgi:hypothetical protein